MYEVWLYPSNEKIENSLAKTFIMLFKDCYSKSKSVVITSMTQTLTVGAIHELPLPQIK